MFIGVGNGNIHWRRPDGTLSPMIDTGLGGFTTGMAFDKLGGLYSTAFNANNIVKFYTTGAEIGGAAGRSGERRRRAAHPSATT